MTMTDFHQQALRAHLLTKDGRDSLFRTEVLPLQGDLLRAARGYTKNPYDAEDLLQETLGKAWTALHSFSPGTNLKAWLFRIMINTWISSRRRSDRRPGECLTDSFTEAQLAAEGRRFGASPSAEMTALQQIPDDDIKRALQALPSSLQATVCYAFLGQFTYREIAEVEGIPVGTVMSRLHRARKLLRADLAHCGFDSRPYERCSRSYEPTMRRVSPRTETIADHAINSEGAQR